MYNYFSHHKLIEGDYKLNQIQIQQQLGRGNSHVFIAIINNQKYALKQIQIKDQVQYQNFLQQITIMKDLSSCNQSMVKYYGYFITKMQIDQYLKKKYACIIMECAQMNLQNLILSYKQTSQRFTIQNLELFVKTIMNALCQLESKHIAHCDIKPENVLIMDSINYSIKLCDVGSCKIVTGQNCQQATILGTVPFLAPQLIKVKTKKIMSNNPFKSDVFSFGLVLLYLISFKKFKSQQRLQVEESTYKQIILEWIKQAKQIINFDEPICKLLNLSLQFDQNKRPLLSQLKQIYMNEQNKKYEQKYLKNQELQKEQQQKFEKFEKFDYNSSYYQSNPSPGNCVNLFKNRKIQKPSTIKTSLNGSAFRITTNSFKTKNGSTRNYSPTLLSPLRKKLSTALSMSPEKNTNFSSNFQIKKLIYINNLTKDLITQINDQQQKTFVLQIPFVPFKKADIVSILPSCGLQVLFMLLNVQCNRLYIEYEKVQSVGLPDDSLVLNIPKIRLNFIQSTMQSGYGGIFKMIVNPLLEVLQIRITESEVTFDQIIELFDLLQQKSPKLNTLLLCWQKNILSPDEHFQLTQKISKLPLKKLYLIMNQNYIKYDKQMAWILPKNCESLYLQYGHNLLNSIINNLSLSLSSMLNLKQLYLNFQNNNLLKGQINMISKTVLDLKNLQKLIFDISLNKIDDLNYLQKNLSQHINLNVIEIRLHKTQTSIDRTITFIKNLKELFQFKLKILKVTINRHINIKVLKQMVNGFCIQKGVKKIISDVIGFDNQYFMVYLKKKPQTFNRNSSKNAKNTISTRKDKLQNALKFSHTVGLGATMNSFHPSTIKSTLIQNVSAIKTFGLCTRLYTMSSTYDNYICLGCCQNKQTAKSTYYCKYCIQHCFHKGHNIVKVYTKTVCSCSHSGCCTSDVSQNVCAQILKIYYKKKFECLKCKIYHCISCIINCKQNHKGFVIEYNQLTYFKCGDKIKQKQKQEISTIIQTD